MVYAGGMAPWWGMDHLRFGIVGATVSLVLMVVVSLLTPAPDKATQDMVDEVRIPKGQTILGSTH
jgi:cation/acetate symporter